MTKVSADYETPEVVKIGGQLVEVELVTNIIDAPKVSMQYTRMSPEEALAAFTRSGMAPPATITGLVQGEVKEGSGVLWCVPVN